MAIILDLKNPTRTKLQLGFLCATQKKLQLTQASNTTELTGLAQQVKISPASKPLKAS